MEDLEWSDDESCDNSSSTTHDERLCRKINRIVEKNPLPIIKPSSSASLSSELELYKNKKVHSKRSKVFSGNVKLTKVKGLFPRELEEEKNRLANLVDYPLVPFHVKSRLGDEILSDLWKQFLRCGSDRHGFILYQHFQDLANEMNKLHQHLPWSSLKFGRYDSDDYISFFNVSLKLCEATKKLDSTSLIPDESTTQQCCSCFSCHRLVRGRKHELEPHSSENHVLDVVYHRTKTLKFGKFKVKHVLEALIESSIPYDSSRLPDSFWKLKSESIVEDIQRLEWIVDCIRTDLDEERALEGESRTYLLPDWLQQEFSPSEILLFKHHFTMIDIDKGGSIDGEELMELTASLGSKITIEEAEELIAEYDLDRSGTIDFTEFMMLMYKIQRGTINLTSNALAQAMIEAKSQLQIFEEIENYSHDPLPNAQILRYGENPIKLEVCLYGPEHTPYVQGRFHLQVTFLDGYPYRIPKVIMLTRIYGVNFLSEIDGIVIFPHLTYIWNASWNLSKLLHHMLSLLEQPDFTLIPFEVLEVVNHWIRCYNEGKRLAYEEAKLLAQKEAEELAAKVASEGLDNHSLTSKGSSISLGNISKRIHPPGIPEASYKMTASSSSSNISVGALNIKGNEVSNKMHASDDNANTQTKLKAVVAQKKVSSDEWSDDDNDDGDAVIAAEGDSRANDGDVNNDEGDGEGNGLEMVGFSEDQNSDSGLLDINLKKTNDSLGEMDLNLSEHDSLSQENITGAVDQQNNPTEDEIGLVGLLDSQKAIVSLKNNFTPNQSFEKLWKCLNRLEQMHANVLFAYMTDVTRFENTVRYYIQGKFDLLEHPENSSQADQAQDQSSIDGGSNKKSLVLSTGEDPTNSVSQYDGFSSMEGCSEQDSLELHGSRTSFAHLREVNNDSDQDSEMEGYFEGRIEEYDQDDS